MLVQVKFTEEFIKSYPKILVEFEYGEIKGMNYHGGVEGGICEGSYLLYEKVESCNNSECEYELVEIFEYEPIIMYIDYEKPIPNIGGEIFWVEYKSGKVERIHYIINGDEYLVDDKNYIITDSDCVYITSIKPENIKDNEIISGS